MNLASNLLGTGWKWASSHVRLIIEYVLIALVVVLAAAVLYNRLHLAIQDTRIAQQAGKINEFSGKLESASQTIRHQVTVNEAQQQALDKLSSLQDASSIVITGLQRDIQTVDAKRAQLRAKLVELEKNNAQAKRLLDTPVPAGLGCLLDGTACSKPAAGDDKDKR